MAVIGTAGHVDHGKSTLVRALTGLEPDRWEEERRRGLTIDLGFAWMTLPDGSDVSFVDVPGHEQFIKNMLSGIEAVDVALVVVAGDEGWMPQTEEHLAVLDLLEINRSVIALTKTDRLDDDLVELARLEIEERVSGTVLESARVIPVSAQTGDGLSVLIDEITDLVSTVPTQANTRPRLWIDRVFTVSGAGTVVTGTLLDGRIRIGDRVAVWPGELPARIRGLQAHEQALEEAAPRTRTAINLGGLDHHEIRRGSMVGVPGQWVTSERILVELKRARYTDELSDRGAYHIHMGSGSWPVRLRVMTEGLARIDLNSPLPITMGDRFILRETGRRLVVGGGRVLDPAPPARRRRAIAAGDALGPILDRNPDERASALLDVRGSESLATLAAQTGGGRPNGHITGDEAVSEAWLDRLISSATTNVSAFHEANPLRPGVGVATLASSLGTTPQMIVAAAESSTTLVVEGAVIRSQDFTIQLSSDQRATITQATAVLDAAGWAVPRVSELDLDEDLLHSLLRDGTLTRVGSDFVYLTSKLRTLVDALDGIEQPFTASSFKDHLGISRKHAIPLLEWADSESITIRSDEERRLR